MVGASGHDTDPSSATGAAAPEACRGRATGRRSRVLSASGGVRGRPTRRGSRTAPVPLGGWWTGSGPPTRAPAPGDRPHARRDAAPAAPPLDTGPLPPSSPDDPRGEEPVNSLCRRAITERTGRWSRSGRTKVPQSGAPAGARAAAAAVRQTRGMPETVEIGLGRSARRGYHLDEIALVPTRRTRGSAVVSTGWQIDAHTFDLPFVAAPSDAVVSPATAVEIERLGGLAVLDGEGLWARYEDADAELAKLDGDTADAAARLRRAGRCRDLLRAAVARAARRPGCGSPCGSRRSTPPSSPRTCWPRASTCSSSRARSSRPSTSSGTTSPGLNLKTFIADLDVPVLVGGVTNYQTALHLMRTGAAGVIIGYGAHLGSTTHAVLGIEVPMATALVDAAAARRDYLDETGGRYVHLVAYGDLATGGDIAKALACGADAVMLGEPLATAAEAPGGGRYWDADRGAPAGAALGRRRPRRRRRRPADAGGAARRADVGPRSVSATCSARYAGSWASAGTRRSRNSRRPS